MGINRADDSVSSRPQLYNVAGSKEPDVEDEVDEGGLEQVRVSHENSQMIYNRDEEKDRGLLESINEQNDRQQHYIDNYTPQNPSQ